MAFSDWFGDVGQKLKDPSVQEALMAAGKAFLPEQWNPTARAFEPIIKGQISRKYGEAQKGKQQISSSVGPSGAASTPKFSDVMGASVGDIASHPNITGFTSKGADGKSFSFKFTSPKDIAGAKVLQNQLAAGGYPEVIQGTDNSGAPANPAGMLPTGTPEIYEQPYAGADGPEGRPIKFSDTLNAYPMDSTGNPPTGPNDANALGPGNMQLAQGSDIASATGYGLSPEELIASEKSAVESVAQPFRNRYNQRMSEQLASHTSLSNRRVPWKVTLPDGRDVVMEFTPQEYVAYQNALWDRMSAQEQAESMVGYRKYQGEAASALAEERQASAVERRLKSQQARARQELIDTKKDEKVPGSDLTYGQANAMGILDDLLKQTHATKLAESKSNLTQDKMLYDTWQKRALAYTNNFMFPSQYPGETPGSVAMRELEQEIPGAKAAIERVQRLGIGAETRVGMLPDKLKLPEGVPPGSKLETRHLKDGTPVKVWRTPDGKLLKERGN